MRMVPRVSSLLPQFSRKNAPTGNMPGSGFITRAGALAVDTHDSYRL